MTKMSDFRFGDFEISSVAQILIVEPLQGSGFIIIIHIPS